MGFTCKDCKNHAPGCHAVCETYKKEKAEYEERRAAYEKERYIQGGLAAQRGKAIGKTLKNRYRSGGHFNEQ